MSNLDPVETPALNLESVSGLQSQHLHTIMHIAFLRDSRARGDSDANRWVGSYTNDTCHPFP